ncbi:MAG: T9SS type A sorting domain-containing protein [Flavobacteriales bacterium]|nr:T9SS type A sorting domain-containing protein [Flavobacteriales bacterium]
MRTTLLLLSAALSLTNVSAQQVQKCCGSSNSTFLLGHQGYVRHSQSLYLPSDLMNATDGMIERLYFRYGSTGNADGVTLTDLMFRIGQTASASFANGNEFFTDLDTVMSSPAYTIPPGIEGEWFGVDLDEPFAYSAGSTLVLDILFDTSTNNSFGTLGSSNTGRKLYNVDQTATTGNPGSSTWQDFGFDLAMPTGVAERSATTLRVVPNPTDGPLRVYLGGSSAGTLVLLDASGRVVQLVRTAAAQIVEMDLSDLPSGVYALDHMDDEGKLAVTRLVRH